MKQEYTVRKGGRTIVNDDKAKDKKPATPPKPDIPKEDDENANQS